MKRLFAVGYKGKILKVGTLEELVECDLVRAKHEHPLLSPIAELSLEVPSRELVGGVMTINSEIFDKHLLWRLDIEYRHHCGPDLYGPFGDIMSVTALDEFEKNNETPVLLNWIAPKAFHKPGLAADLVVLLSHRADTYFVGITGNHPPKEGQPATIGGFLDVLGTHLETPLEAALREALEELGISVTDENGKFPVESEILSRETFTVYIDVANEFFHGKLSYLGVVETATTEQHGSGRKRVYWAFGYVLHIELPEHMEVSEALIAEMFVSPSNEEPVFVSKVGDGMVPDFGNAHHNDLLQLALKKIQKVN